MRYIFLVSGFVFFSSVFLAGLWAERPLALVVRDASIGAVVGGLIGRWFWNKIVDIMSRVAAVKRAELEAAAKALRQKKAGAAGAQATK